MMPDLSDIADMLRWLGDRGWKPVLYAETPLGRHEHVAQWVCYPQGAVRVWTSARASDPLTAVRALYLWAKEHPNERVVSIPRPLEPITEAVLAPAQVPAADVPARRWWDPIVRRQ